MGYYTDHGDPIYDDSDREWGEALDRADRRISELFTLRTQIGRPGVARVLRTLRVRRGRR